ncbi:chitooligosaccharidolytic beta-N-acetylglucosaminidase [Papilio machaon]|uniref:chitooligosaccharidolytic beta-N-acetylglucosaminidase n=1 Tax=Papilio machaon TaxID=76193 RepID=UPI001E664C66|nr:chitooligosaccharidolytic beta-N-acetylglucosaminidase [Papilio machaon]
MVWHWILLVTVFVHSARSNDVHGLETNSDTYKPSWVYKCDPEYGCERSDLPSQGHAVNTTNIFKSLDLCRTVCGRFGGMWPRPVTASLSSNTIKIHPNYIRFDLRDVPLETREILVEMTQITSTNLLAECGGNVTDVVTTPVVVHLSVKSSSLTLTWDTNEEYFLDIQSKGNSITIHISAETVYGARHALETLTHLTASDRPVYSTEQRCGLHILAGATVRDRPAYGHRGLVLDTSRNFMPMVDIKRTIDGMAATKMNVFHWHVTDSHSFPLESKSVPQFTKYGAYSAQELYRTEEVRELIQYAKVRGVRVVIEIDSPAHAGNGWQWGKDYGYGDLAVCVNAESWRRLCIQPPCGQLNPANQAVYRVLRRLYKDIVDLLPKPALFHVGGDEVHLGCWNSSEEIVNYMKHKGFDTDVEGFIRLWAEFHSKALQIWDEEILASGGEKQPVLIWSSELTQPGRIQNYLDKDRYIIEVWEPLSSPLLTQLMRLGYKTISIPKDIWYLDHGLWGKTKYSNWRRMYGHLLPRDPTVLGGEVALWSEYIDAQALDTRVWPRAAAVGERLWSDLRSGFAAAEPRMQRHRARLLARGLRPDVLSPAWCAHHDSRCF